MSRVEVLELRAHAWSRGRICGLACLGCLSFTRCRQINLAVGSAHHDLESSTSILRSFQNTSCQPENEIQIGEIFNLIETFENFHPFNHLTSSLLFSDSMTSQLH